MQHGSEILCAYKCGKPNLQAEFFDDWKLSAKPSRSHGSQILPFKSGRALPRLYSAHSFQTGHSTQVMFDIHLPPCPKMLLWCHAIKNAWKVRAWCNHRTLILRPAGPAKASRLGQNVTSLSAGATTVPPSRRARNLGVAHAAVGVLLHPAAC